MLLPDSRRINRSTTSCLQGLTRNKRFFIGNAQCQTWREVRNGSLRFPILEVVNRKEQSVHSCYHCMMFWRKVHEIWHEPKRNSSQLIPVAPVPASAPSRISAAETCVLMFFFATVVAENMTCVMMGLLWFAYSDWGIWFENDKPIETNWNFKNTFQGQASSWKSSRNWLPQSCRQGQRLPRGYGCNTTCIQTPGLNKHRTHGCLHCFLRWRRHLPKFR